MRSALLAKALQGLKKSLAIEGLGAGLKLSVKLNDALAGDLQIMASIRSGLGR